MVVAKYGMAKYVSAHYFLGVHKELSPSYQPTCPAKHIYALKATLRVLQLQEEHTERKLATSYLRGPRSPVLAGPALGAKVTECYAFLQACRYLQADCLTATRHSGLATSKLETRTCVLCVLPAKAQAPMDAMLTM